MSKESSNHFDESRASEEEGLIQEALVQGKKINPKEIVFITRDPSGRIVWLEVGETEAEAVEHDGRPSGLKHILERHSRDFSELGISEKEIPSFIQNLILSGTVIGRDRGGIIYRNSMGEGLLPIAVVIGSNGYIVSAYPDRKWSRKSI